MTDEFVRSAEPVAPWQGGKSRLARTIVARLEQIPHDTYAEPFVGMGGIFLRRSYRPKCEVANDLNGEIINLFRILQRHYPQFLDCLKFQITSRREFERLKACDPATLTDLERAARFLYLQRTSFGGKVISQTFGVSAGRPGRFDLSTVGPMLEAAHERLSGVIFENLSWEELIARWDAPATLFYLDPPYFGGETDYGAGMFDRDDFARMAEILAGIKGAFILSINDRPEIRATFADFLIDEVRLNYSINDGDGKRVGELIIGNRRVAEGLL